MKSALGSLRSAPRNEAIMSLGNTPTGEGMEKARRLHWPIVVPGMEENASGKARQSFG